MVYNSLHRIRFKTRKKLLNAFSRKIKVKINILKYIFKSCCHLSKKGWSEKSWIFEYSILAVLRTKILHPVNPLIYNHEIYSLMLSIDSG
jgi:hypothetical protein